MYSRPVVGCFAVASQSLTMPSNSSLVVLACVAPISCISAPVPPASAVFRSPARADLNGSWSFHSGCFGASDLHAIDGKCQLEVHRLLGPQRAVVVERRDPLGRRHELRRTRPGNRGDEVHDGLLRLAGVPRRQRIARICAAASCTHQRQEERGGDEEGSWHVSHFTCLHAAESEMVRAGADVALAAGADHVARAVLIGAEKGAAAMDALLHAGFARIERVGRTLGLRATAPAAASWA